MGWIKDIKDIFNSVAVLQEKSKNDKEIVNMLIKRVEKLEDSLGRKFEKINKDLTEVKTIVKFARENSRSNQRRIKN